MGSCCSSRRAESPASRVAQWRLTGIVSVRESRLKLPENLLKDCTALQNISLHGNPITMDQFQQMEGFNEFEARRRKKFDKQIDSRVMMGSTALDEGIDFH
nr:unnamed protein product [Digitaria exilis]